MYTNDRLPPNPKEIFNFFIMSEFFSLVALIPAWLPKSCTTETRHRRAFCLCSFNTFQPVQDTSNPSLCYLLSTNKLTACIKPSLCRHLLSLPSPVLATKLTAFVL